MRKGSFGLDSNCDSSVSEQHRVNALSAICLNGSALRCSDLNAIMTCKCEVLATLPQQLRIDNAVLCKMTASRNTLVKYAQLHPVYGFTTGVGVMKTKAIHPSGDERHQSMGSTSSCTTKQTDFQIDILRAHATEIEDPEEIPAHYKANDNSCFMEACSSVSHSWNVQRRLLICSLVIQANHYASGWGGVTPDLLRCVLKCISALVSRNWEKAGAFPRLLPYLPGGSTFGMSDVDMGAIVTNCHIALWMLDFSGYQPAPGEGLPLMSHNAVCLAASAWLFHKSSVLFSASLMTTGASLYGLQGDISPFSDLLLQTLPLDSKNWKFTAHQSMCSRIIRRFSGFPTHDSATMHSAGSMQQIQGRALQDCLSMRTTAVVSAACFQRLTQFEHALDFELSKYPINPAVLADANTIVTSPSFDPISVLQAMKDCFVCLIHLATRSVSRTSAVIDPQHSGLPQGFIDVKSMKGQDSNDWARHEHGGPHNRNILTISAANLSSLLAEGSKLTTMNGPCRVADGVEDVCSGFSIAVGSCNNVCKNIQNVLACEITVAMDAIACRKGVSIAHPRLSSLCGASPPLASFLQAVPARIIDSYSNHEKQYCLHETAKFLIAFAHEHVLPHVRAAKQPDSLKSKL